MAVLYYILYIRPTLKLFFQFFSLKLLLPYTILTKEINFKYNFCNVENIRTLSRMLMMFDGWTVIWEYFLKLLRNGMRWELHELVPCATRWPALALQNKHHHFKRNSTHHLYADAHDIETNEYTKMYKCFRFRAYLSYKLIGACLQ